MPTLNRFPLLGLWAEEAARRIGYTRGEAEALGHAYAVLYAIRLQKARHPEPAGDKEKAPARRKKKPAGVKHLEFGGDTLDVLEDSSGKIRGLVGGEQPQTAKTYQASVERKFPPGYYDRLQASFRQLLKTYPPRRLDSRLIYDLYDEWKRQNAVGRLVDLDKLIAWCQERTAAQRLGARRPGRPVRK